MADRVRLALITAAWSALPVFANNLTADDWPAWRGPDRSGICREQGLATTWPEGGPKLLWKTTGLGVGFSTPSVAGGVLYVMGNREDEELVIALDLQAEGRELWAAAVGKVRHTGGGYPGPRSTPTVDGDNVYAVGLNGDLVCLEAASGKLVWRRDFVADFNGKVPGWGFCESVLIDAPWVVATPGGPEATLVAFDKSNGSTVWSSPVGDPAGYASAVTAEIDGVKQYLQFTRNGVIGVAAGDGEPLWRYDAPANGTANCSTPLVAGNRVFAASGYGTGGGAADVKRAAGVFSAEEAFFSKQMKNHHGGMILVDGHIYGSDDPGILTCIELATGETKWQERGPGKCSLIYFDGHVIARSERGKVSLVKISPKGGEVIGEFEQPDRSNSPSWPHPVIADGRLYLRDQDLLLCYDLKR